MQAAEMVTAEAIAAAADAHHTHQFPPAAAALSSSRDDGAGGSVSNLVLLRKVQLLSCFIIFVIYLFIV